MSSLAERIRLIILEQKVKQIDFARVLGVSANYINLLANGKKTNISAALAMRIEENYGYGSYWILSGEGEKRTVYFSRTKREALRKIEKMDDGEVDKVLAFVSSLGEANKIEV